MGDSSNPDILYHYTTASALISIIKTRQLWLTEYRFLNDRREFLHARDLFGSAFPQIDLRRWLAKLADYPDIQNELNKQVIRWERNLFGSSLEPPEDYLLYVFSLSADGDSLAQWRAYGNGEVCIGFRRDALRKERIAPTAQGLVLREVTYPDQASTQLNRLEKKLDAFVDAALKSQKTPSLSLSDEDKLEFAFIKHKGFETEKEWRVVMWQPPPDFEPEMTIRAIGRYLVPYLKIDFCPSSAISDIVFGPEADFELVDHFQNLVRRHPWMFLRDCRVSRSKIPYRG